MAKEPKEPLEKRDLQSISPGELPDDATHEEIVEFVDQLVVKQGKESGKPPEDEGKDAKKQNKSAGDDRSAGDGKDDDSAGKDSDDDDTEDEDKEEDEEDAEGGGEQGWLDDDLKEQVSALGITDEQLAEFTSREELDRAMRLLDAAALAAGKKAGKAKDGDEEDDAGEEDEPVQRSAKKARGKDVRKKPAKPATKRRNADDEEDADDDDYQVGINPDDYDENLVNEFNKLHGHYKSRIAALSEQFDARLAKFEEAEQLRETKAEEDQFDAIVDTLGHVDLFGESGKESKSQLANRRTLFGDFKAYLKGMETLGRKGRADKAFVTRVLNLSFADHIFKQKQKQLTRKISKQSGMRMGGSVVKPTDHRHDGPPETDPELLQMYRELERQSG